MLAPSLLMLAISKSGVTEKVKITISLTSQLMKVIVVREASERTNQKHDPHTR